MGVLLSVLEKDRFLKLFFFSSFITFKSSLLYNILNFIVTNLQILTFFAKRTNFT